MDEKKATMLFNNLISNAIKYSPPDSSIEIQLKNGQFSIKDQGIGIAKEELEKIFERYRRSTEYAGGFGIGLDIVKSIAKEYSIDLGINSILKQGTEFKLSFKSHKI